MDLYFYSYILKLHLQSYVSYATANMDLCVTENSPRKVVKSTQQTCNMFLSLLSIYTGKTTLTCSLQKALGAVLLKSPPHCLTQFRPRFDAEPALIRRAFYALGNYITAAQIARESAHAPVIVDRYIM